MYYFKVEILGEFIFQVYDSKFYDFYDCEIPHFDTLSVKNDCSFIKKIYKLTNCDQMDVTF